MQGITHAYPIIVMGLILLMGCGSSHEGKTTMTGPPSLAFISGKVAPGPLWNVPVSAVALDSEGTIVSELGRTRTDKNGDYEIICESSHTGGVILLRIQTDRETRMKCPLLKGCTDAGFGEWMTLPPDMSMTAACAPSGEQTTAHITPLTHMAAARLLSSGRVSPEAAVRANSEISQMVGINVLTSDIGDITQPDNHGPSLRHALFLAGMADYLTRFRDKTYEQGIQDLADSFQSGTLRSDMTRDIIDRVKHAMADVPGIRAVSGLYSGDMIMSHTSLESIINSLGSRDYDPEPSDGAGKSPVDQAKLLLNQARTMVMQIIDSPLDPLASLNIESVSVDSFMGEDIHELVQILGEVLRQVLDTVDLYGVPDDEVLAIADRNQTILGRLYVTSPPPSSGDRAWLFNGDLLASQPIRIRDLALRTSLEDDSLSRIDLLVNEDLFLFIDGLIGNELMALQFQNTGVTVSIRDRRVASIIFKGAVLIRLADRTFSGEAELAWSDRDTHPTVSHLAWAGPEGDDIESVLEDMAFNSQSRVSLDPTVDMDTVRFDASAIAARGSKTIPYDDLSGTTRMILASYADQCSEEFTKTDSLVLTYPHDGRVFLTCGGLAQGGLAAQNTLSFDLFQAFYNDLAQTVSDDYGNLLEPSSLSFQTDVFGCTQVISMSYELTLSEIDDLFFTGHMTLTASAVIPDMPALTATLSVSRTHRTGGSLSMTVGYNGKNYTLYFESPDMSADRVGTLILSNPDDVKFVLYPNITNYRESYGTVYVGREIVGHIQIANGLPLVRYVDGTFESLF